MVLLDKFVHFLIFLFLLLVRVFAECLPHSDTLEVPLHLTLPNPQIIMSQTEGGN